ncbi:MAG: hypothetical protein WDM78_11945 [Puia sp.]
MNGSAELSLAKPVGFQKYKRALFLICFFSSLFGGTVSTLMSVYLPDAIRDLLQNTGTQSADNISATINSIFIFGMDSRWNHLGYILRHTRTKKNHLSMQPFVMDYLPF